MDDTSQDTVETSPAPKRETVTAPDGSEGRVYVIPHPNLTTFNDRFAKLVKRATRLGLTVPTYTELKVEPKVVKETTDDIDPETGRAMVVEHVIMMHHLAIFHPNVVVSGWEFVAKVEHTEEGNILHVLPGKTIPPQYRTATPDCDHCKVKRHRRDTFILRKVEEYIQIGRQCLADYLGRDAERYADAAEVYYTLDQLAAASEMYDSEGGSGGGSRYVMLDNYLGYVAEVIAHVGWKSRGSAFKFGGQATADIALREMFKRKYDPRHDLFRQPTDKSFQVGAEAIQWAEVLTDEEVTHSDYLWNIRIIARRGVVGDKQFGFAASIVSSYQRHIGELELRTRKVTQESHWVGEVGQRTIFHLLVEKVVQLESDFGVSQLHLMSDDSGNKFIWYGHGTPLDAGRKVYLKGTIVAHNERQGVKQTRLNRADVVEMKSYLVVYQGKEYHFDASDLKAAKKMLPSVLDIPKVPRGLTITEVNPSAPTEPPTPPGSWQGDSDTTWEPVAPQPTTSDEVPSSERFATYED
jgi:hypothetical protein